ncbi:zinc finger, RING/FYVE/PHD-type [Artemisia annua]|uniref:RING-type E3 ubiquitin transferase n=1 Tax=Artemisia annua TaxID=35608 RepID=A0A2U1NG72_ARTAN|nr:zinc finger, RING/FYVE/PHD-type [Artemisia annua]
MARLWICKYFENFESVLFVNGPPYDTLQMEFTSNNGVVTVSRLVSRDKELLEDEEGYREQSTLLARLVLWYESLCTNGIFSLAKAIEQSIKISRLSKEKEEVGDICAICHEEFRGDEVIGTLKCKHSYHEECIKKWLLLKRTCPICRAVFCLRFT